MKKKKIVMLVIIAIIIIGVIIGVISFIKNNDNKETKLSQIYNQLTSNQTYLFTMIENDTNKTIMAKKQDKTVIDQYTDESHSTTIVKDGNTYLILHDREEYYVYLRNSVEQNILTDGLEELKDKEHVDGTEKIYGKKYSYEEYDGSTIFMLSNDIALEEEGIKTKFYFDKKDNLTYIKTIYGEEEEILEVSLSYEVEDSIFEIPSNYAEN